jgi:hypothetical protein
VIKIGTHIKTTHGTAVIVEHLEKEHPKHEECYTIKLDNPGYYHQARTHFPMGKPVHYEAGILFLFESDFEIVDFKQGELF